VRIQGAANTVAQIIVQARTIDQVIAAIGHRGASAGAEQILDGILDQLHLGLAMVLLTHFIHFTAGITKRFFVKIKQVKAGIVGERMIGNEFHGFPGGSAGDAKDISGTAFASHTIHFIADLHGEEFGAIPDGAARAMIQKVRIDQFGKNRFTFRLVPDDHAHHFIVAGESQRLGEGAVKKRRAQKIRM
jgi:hypothetical protein